MVLNLSKRDIKNAFCFTFGYTVIYVEIVYDLILVKSIKRI